MHVKHLRPLFSKHKHIAAVTSQHCFIQRPKCFSVFLTCKLQQYNRTRQLHVLFWFFLIPVSPALGLTGCWSQFQTSWWEGRVTTWTSCQIIAGPHGETHNHSDNQSVAGDPANSTLLESNPRRRASQNYHHLTNQSRPTITGRWVKVSVR